MMTIARTFSILTLCTLLASCAGEYRIEGTSQITGLDGRSLSLRTLRDGRWLAVDSAEVVHGYFTMKGRPDSVMMVALFMDDENLMPLVLEPGRIKVTIDNAQFLASGTPLNDALYDFIGQRNRMELMLDEFDRSMQPTRGDSLTLLMNRYVHDFITANCNNVLGPGIFMIMCSTLPYPVVTPQLDSILRDVPQSFLCNRLVEEWLAKARENARMLEEHRTYRPFY
ncbi:MAG: DUF4369 domain-containing protein [Prevotellaceae bacterium]|jgi:hypothetical protein|nr:DUF4369 domain-containing protein [Prevotellaceae bacterium]